MTYWSNWESGMMGWDHHPWFGAGIGLLTIWSFLWRALAIWKSARNDQRFWFVTFLLPINTLGIIEILYLFVFATNKLILVTEPPKRLAKRKK